MKTELFDMLTYARPMGSRTERAFIEKYVLSLPNAELDFVHPHSNVHVQVGTSPILWSCHTDTVHWHEGRQNIRIKRGLISLHKRSKSTCLGADDTAGVYLMRQMVLRGVPGHYVFHYGEERGGIGSTALAKEHPNFLREFTYAIALDRSGYSDIITHQMHGKTASTSFAWSLADALNLSDGMAYSPCSSGIYTDTAEYTDLIGECTNISVGYGGAHSSHERLDPEHVEHLLNALVALDQSTLKAARKPGEVSSFWDRFNDASYIDVDDITEVADDEYEDDNDTQIDLYLDPDYAEVRRALALEARKRFKGVQ